MAQIKFRTSGGAWQTPKEIKTWDGSQWRRRTGYRWMGSTWDPIIVYRQNLMVNGSIAPSTWVEIASSGIFSHTTYSDNLSMVVYTDDEDTYSHLQIRSSQDINLTNYSTMYVDCRAIYNNNGITIGVKKSTDNTVTWGAKYTALTLFARTTIQIDISSLSGMYRMAADVEAAGGDTHLLLYNIWIE